MTMKFCRKSFYRSTPARLLQAAMALAMCCGNAVAALGQGHLPGAQGSPVRPAQTLVSPSGSGPKIQASPRPGSFTDANAYTVHESARENGTIIKEYATAGGVVFAVQWRGPVLPDLDALLGTYFAAFRAEAQQARAAGRRGSPMVVATDTLVVNSAGRMRNFSGWAYAPGLVPAEVAIKVVLQ